MKVAFTSLIAILTAFVVWAGPADAQVRVRGHVSVAVGRPYYYRPYYYRPSYYRPYFYGSHFYGSYFYGPGWHRPFYWYPYSAIGFGYGRYDGEGSLRMQVTPRDTEVYIDNYYAGTVDDFDGLFQRLHVEPGAHDITLYRDGFRTVRQRIYIQPTGTFRLRYNMVPLAPGELQEARPAEPPSQGAQASPGPQAPGAPYPPPNQYPPYPAGPPPQQQQQQQGGSSLAVRVQPGGADVFIDGERWEGGDDRLVVQVAPGVHHIEVRREGYRTYATEITVRPGETSNVNISLTRQP